MLNVYYYRRFRSFSKNSLYYTFCYKRQCAVLLWIFKHATVFKCVHNLHSNKLTEWDFKLPAVNPSVVCPNPIVGHCDQLSVEGVKKVY